MYGLAQRDRRKTERLDLALWAEMREAGNAFLFEIELSDLSCHGYRCRSMTPLVEGQTVYVLLPSFAAQESVVVRATRDHDFGCRFVQPLHQAVVDHIGARARRLQAAPKRDDRPVDLANWRAR